MDTSKTSSEVPVIMSAKSLEDDLRGITHDRYQHCGFDSRTH